MINTNVQNFDDVRRALTQLVLDMNLRMNSYGLLRVDAGAAEAVAIASWNKVTQWDQAQAEGFCIADAGNNKIIVNADGSYLVQYDLRVVLSAGTEIGSAIFVNGAESSPKIEDTSYPTGTYHDPRGFGVLDLLEGDEVDLRVYPNANVNMTSRNYGSRLMVRLIKGA